MSSEEVLSAGDYPVVKKGKSVEEDNNESLLWIVEVHRWICYLDTTSEIQVFDSKANAEFYLAQIVCEDMEYLTKNQAPEEIRGNFEAVKSFLEAEQVAGTARVDDLIYIMERSHIYTKIVNQANLKYTEPKPAVQFGFDDFALGLQQIATEMDIYRCQLGHPDQEVSTEDMKLAMVDHIKTLQDMQIYQQYLIKIDMCEEMAYFEVDRALKMANSLMKDIQKILNK